jgi:hypothetical protein
MPRQTMKTLGCSCPTVAANALSEADRALVCTR